MPVAEIAAGIGAINNALGIARTLREAEKAYDAATYKLKIAELIDEMVSGKLALSEAKETISEPRTRGSLRRSWPVRHW